MVVTIKHFKSCFCVCPCRQGQFHQQIYTHVGLNKTKLFMYTKTNTWQHYTIVFNHAFLSWGQSTLGAEED